MNLAGRTETDPIGTMSRPCDDVSDHPESCDPTSPLDPPAYDDPVGVRALFKSAVEAFRLLEPWCLATCVDSHPIIRLILGRLKMQAHRYFDAINNSLRCSDQGKVFVIHAIQLCEALKEKKFKNTEILKFIGRMQKEASRAQKDARTTRTQFVAVTGQMGKERERIPELKERVERDQQNVRRAMRRWRFSEKCATWIIDHCTFDSDGVKSIIAWIGALSSAVPHVGFILPIAIPVAVLTTKFAAEAVKLLSEHAIANRQTQVVRCQDAPCILEVIAKELELVIQSVDKFATWWETTDDNLKNIKKQIELKGNIDDIVAQIEQHLIRKLQDFYPSSYRRKAPRDYS
ncbi:hypothetical protein K438DRAFT_1939957 [Mycena galopus ATCC 62051]|nr:hypothetical protein K438DRAFT_1939957 [Mycena galopus ATCC 62051]